MTVTIVRTVTLGVQTSGLTLAQTVTDLAGLTDAPTATTTSPPLVPSTSLFPSTTLFPGG